MRVKSTVTSPASPSCDWLTSAEHRPTGVRAMMHAGNIEILKTLKRLNANMIVAATLYAAKTDFSENLMNSWRLRTQ